MTKSELILKIANKNSFLYQKDIYKIVDTLFNSVTKALKDGDRVELEVLEHLQQRFKCKNRQKSKTGDPVAIPKKNMPFFKMGKLMKERINS